MSSRNFDGPRTLFTADAVPRAPEDSHYGLRAKYRADKAVEKLDLVIGAYRDGDGKPWVLPVVKKARMHTARLPRIQNVIFHNDPGRNNEYLPIPGLQEFTSAAQKLILGSDSSAIKEGRVCSFQTISGTGAVHLGGLFLSNFAPRPKPHIYLSSPSWDNHARIFENVHLSVKRYPYYLKETNSIDFDGMLSTLETADIGSIVLLQPCAHNPTGLDLNELQWQRVAQAVRSRALLPFFDCAYQGFASGSLSNDRLAIRYFVEQGIELVIAQSFSKNLGLYGQRVGCFHFVAAPGLGAQDVVTRVASQLAVLQRSEISTPPIYGAKIASIILNSEQLFAEWERDLCTMADRIINMRKLLRQELERRQTPGKWNHITEQIGMFSFTGLSEAQVVELREKWHIYMLTDGRVSMSGLNLGNIDNFVNAIDDVVRRIKGDKAL